MNRCLLAPLALLLGATLLSCTTTETVVVTAPPGPRTFLFTDYGGVGDGKTWNTDAFANATAALDQAGGGILDVPPGTYLTLPIRFTNHMNLHLEPGATIQFPADLTAYGLPDPSKSTQDQINAANRNVPKSLIWGDHLTDVSITGSGTIDGGGTNWWEWSDKNAKKHAGIFYDRPKLIIFRNSNHILVEGVTLQNSPMWNFVPTLSSDITVRGITVLAPQFSPNTDAVDPDSCDHVVVRDCVMNEGDDGIAIKADDGPCSNILIENLQCHHGHGISVGSETYGGIHDVVVRHCTFDGSKWAIRIKSNRDRGNSLYNIVYDDIQINNVETAIDIDMYYHDPKGEKAHAPQPVTDFTPLLRDVKISNVTVTNADSAGRIIGLPEMPIDGIKLTSVQITCRKGLDIRDAKNIILNQVTITAAESPPVTTENAQVTTIP
jgi:polygalacturonase